MNNKKDKSERTKAREIFEQAVEINGQDERRDFVQSECDSDTELLAMVEQLLKAHDDATGLFHSGNRGNDFVEPGDQPALIDPDMVDSPRLERSGMILDGRYKLRQNIGEGGMGSVWVAEQLAPVKRKVAIKLIKAGMDSKQVLARFEAERQALALMDHPNIAKVFDGGMTGQARPYFVMEYVKGIPLTEYCDQARVPVCERLQLFIQVCQAIQHAHQKGIIHRDLKPSNILICLYDGKPVPKVIDFGLAKAMNQTLTDLSTFTAHGMTVGTPIYMSPEQAELNNLDIDTRTDIYALGVILYEILVGSTPLEKALFKEAAFNEILRLIKEVEPPRPSTRLRSSASLLAIAAQRNVEPQQLCKSLAGDLDWIVMKSLEKNRSRRYETANSLSSDVQRYLDGKPVDARPPSQTYRMQKFLQRNKGLAVSVSAVVLLLVAGTIISSLFAWQAAVARSEAVNESTRAERNAREAKRNADEADIARALSESRRDSMLRQVTIIESMFSSINPGSTTITDDNSLREVLGQQLVETAQLLERDVVGSEELSLISSIGAALSAISLPEESMAVNSRVMELASRVSVSAGQLSVYRMRLAASHNGLSQFDQTIEILASEMNGMLNDESIPAIERLGAINTLAYAYQELSNREQSWRWYETIKTKLNDSSIVGLEPQEYENWLSTAAWGIARARLALNPNVENLQLMEAACKQIENAKGSHHIDTISSMRQLSEAAGALGIHESAQRFGETAWQRSNNKFGPGNDLTVLCLNSLVVAYGRCAGDPKSKKRLEEVLPLAERGLKLLNERLRECHPTSIAVLGNLASGYGVVGNLSKCIEMKRQAVQIAEQQYGRESDNTQFQIYGLATALKESGELEEAISLLGEYHDFCKSNLGADAARTGEIAAELRSLRRRHWLHDTAEKILEQSSLKNSGKQ